MAKLTISYSNLPDDELVMIPGLPGEFRNGNTYDVSLLEGDLYLGDKEPELEVVADQPAEEGEE